MFTYRTEREGNGLAYQSVFKRYELKYMIDDEQCELIKEAMKPYMKDDKYGKKILWGSAYCR